MPLVEYEDYIEDTTEKYDESNDEDFNPDSLPPDEASSSSEDEDATTKPAQRKRKRKAPSDEELDSGDEVTIKAAKKRKAKKLKKGGREDADAEDLIFSDDEGGDGGLIKTRAQRRVEKKERRPLARTEGATVDVDALWAELMAAPLKPAPLYPEKPQEQKPSAEQPSQSLPAQPSQEEEDHVAVKKTYTFAGQDTTEEKTIPRSHLDKYLSDGWTPTDASEKQASADKSPDEITDPKSKIRRPLRRPTRFDPNPTGFVRTLPPEHQLTWPRKSATKALHQAQENLMPPPEVPKARPEKTQKLNVVDKSRMDWTGFVDKEGIADELDTHGKTKEAYLGRMEFLAGVEARREEERKRARTTTATAV